MHSASQGHLEVVKILVEHGADLNVQIDVSYYRPLPPPTTCIRDICCVSVKRIVDMYVPETLQLVSLNREWEHVCLYVCLYVCVYMCMNLYIS